MTVQDNTTITIDYYNDVLCVWAYVAQVKVDELRREFGARVVFNYRFIPLFGNIPKRLGEGWKEQGGYAGYSQHVQEIGKQFDHVEIHPEIWTRNVPRSSFPVQLFLKAVQQLIEQKVISSRDLPDHGGRNLFEEACCRVRLAFFRDLKDVSSSEYLRGLARDLELPLAEIQQLIDNGEAYAGLCGDIENRDEMKIEGSPTFLFNEGRQKLYGNVGYKVIAANVQELMDHNLDIPIWC